MPGVRGVPHPHRGSPRSPQTRARIAAGVRAYHARNGHGHPSPSGGGSGGGGSSSAPARRRQPSADHPDADTRRRVANAQRGLADADAKKKAEKQHQKDLRKAQTKDLAGAFGKGWKAGQGGSAGDVHEAANKVKQQVKKKFPKPTKAATPRRPRPTPPRPSQ